MYAISSRYSMLSAVDSMLSAVDSMLSAVDSMLSAVDSMISAVESKLSAAYNNNNNNNTAFYIALFPEDTKRWPFYYYAVIRKSYTYTMLSAVKSMLSAVDWIQKFYRLF